MTGGQLGKGSLRYWEEVSETERESFVFYRSFYEAIKDVPKKYRSVIYEAVFEYVFDSQEPSLSGVPSALWKLIRPQIDASQKRYENSKKGAEYGKMGGRPKKTKESEKPLKGYEEKPLKDKKSETLNVNVNSNVNENVNVNVNDNASEPDGEQTTHTDTPSEITGRPSNLDVLGEMVSKGYQLNGESLKAFMDYNDERGWKMDWRLALKRWADKEKPPDKVPKQNKAGKFANFPQRDDPQHKALVDQLIAQQIGGD